MSKHQPLSLIERAALVYDFDAGLRGPLNPPRNGEGDRDAKRRGGGGPRSDARSGGEAGPLRQACGLPPPRAGEDQNANLLDVVEEAARVAEPFAFAPAGAAEIDRGKLAKAGFIVPGGPPNDPGLTFDRQK